MKKTIFALLLILAVASASLAIENQEKASEKKAFTLKEVSPFTYCCIPHKGPFTEIEKVIGQLIQALQSQNVPPGGPMIGVYYNSPEEVKPEDLKWEIGFPVTPQILVQAPLEKKQWTFNPVASALHVGPHEKVGETIIKIFEWMKTKNLTLTGPVLERYLDMDPSRVDPEKLRTEVWIPCKKQE